MLKTVLSNTHRWDCRHFYLEGKPYGRRFHRTANTENGRPTKNAPRANTRFLRNIIRETDSHNAALKAKEAEEARARLRRSRGDDRSSPAARRHGSDHRNRRADFQVKPRRRNETNDVDAHLRSRRRRSERSSSSSRSEDDRERKHRRHRRLDSESHRSAGAGERKDHHRHRRHHHRHHWDRHDLSQSTDENELQGRAKKRKHRHLSRSPSRSRLSSEDLSNGQRHRQPDWRRHRSRSSSPPADQSRRRQRTSKEEVQAPRSDDKAAYYKSKHSSHSASDSDPLESIVGPAPPPREPKVRARGRGAFASSAAMDAHFAANYDPSIDAHPNSDSENDWDQALEALRDRQRWKQQGADRLRSAGFTEEEVSKWEKGGEKREEDVRWKGRGEGREWARGKVVEDDEIGDKTPDYGRLKGT